MVLNSASLIMFAYAVEAPLSEFYTWANPFRESSPRKDSDLNYRPNLVQCQLMYLKGE